MKKKAHEKMIKDVIIMRTDGLTYNKISKKTKLSVSTIKRICKGNIADYLCNTNNYKPINNCSNYVISRTGQVVNITNGQILKPKIKNNKETLQIYTDDRTRIEKSLKRWVYETWLGEAPSNKKVLSKCKTTTSFVLSDLYLGDMKDINRSGKNNKKVILKTNDGKEYFYKSIKDCAKKNFFSYSAIQNALAKNNSLSIGRVYYNQEK